MTLDCSLVDTGNARVRTVPDCILKALSWMAVCLQRWLVIIKLRNDAFAI